MELDLTDLCRTAARRLEARTRAPAAICITACELAAQAAMGDPDAQAKVRAVTGPEDKAILERAYALLRTEPDFWVAKLAIAAHTTPLPGRHPSARFVARTFATGREGGGGAEVRGTTAQGVITQGKNVMDALTYIQEAQSNYQSGQDYVATSGTDPNWQSESALSYATSAKFSAMAADSAVQAVQYALSKTPASGYDSSIEPTAVTLANQVHADAAIVEQEQMAGNVDLAWFEAIAAGLIDDANVVTKLASDARVNAGLDRSPGVPPGYPGPTPIVMTAGGGRAHRGDGGGHGGHGAHGHGGHGGGHGVHGGRVVPPQAFAGEWGGPCCESCGEGLQCEGRPLCLTREAAPGFPGHEMAGVRPGGRG